jgi:hypothetical protein
MTNPQITVTTNPPNLVQVIDGSISVSGGGSITGNYVETFNGLTGAVTGVTTGTSNTFIPRQNFLNGISAANGFTLTGRVNLNGQSFLNLVSSVNGQTGSITNVAKRNEANIFTDSQTISGPSSDLIVRDLSSNNSLILIPEQQKISFYNGQFNSTVQLTSVYEINDSSITIKLPPKGGTLALTNDVVSVNSQTGITYTLLNSDNGKLLTFDSGSSVTVTIPSGLPVGFHCTALQLNTNGQVGFTTASGVTLKSYDSLFKIIGQDGLATIWSYAPNVYNLSGNLTVGYDLYSPLTAAFTISDFQNIVERSATTLEFGRSIVENNRERFASPGTRVSFQTNATDLKLNLYWNAEIYNVLDPTGTTIPPVVNNIGAVLENGTEIGTFTWNTPLTPGYTTNIFGLTSGNKTISIVWPYAGGLELKSVELNPGSSITAASVPSTKIAVGGDSISQGFSSTKVTTTWPYLLRNLQNKQVINLANAGTVCEAEHANALQGLTAIDAVIYMIGFNDYAAQTPVNTFKNNVIQWIENGYGHQGYSGGTFYISSTIYSTFPTPGGGITLGSYRQAVSEAVDATKISLDATNIVYVDGLSLMTNSSDRLDGTVHPNDLGASEIATSFDTELNS